MQGQLHSKTHFLLLLKIALKSYQKKLLIIKYELMIVPKALNNLLCLKLNLKEILLFQSFNV